MFLLEDVRLVNPDEDHDFPLTVRAPRPGYVLGDWLSQERNHVWDIIREHGAILFRGFSVDSIAAFQNAVLSLTDELTEEYGDLPASEPGNPFVRKVTPYASDHAILFHNEGSHTPRWPRYQWFYCNTPAPAGGETPIVQCDRVYAALPAHEREMFEKLGLTYVRNFIEGLDVPWQSFFGSSDPRVVESKCEEVGSTCSWDADGGLLVSTKRPAVLWHHERQRPVFFNQVLLHHPAGSDPDMRAELLNLFGPDGFPRNVKYGDGSPIPDTTINNLLSTASKLAVCFSWQVDDVMMIDNVAVAHARRPYRGDRRVYAVLGRFNGDAEYRTSAAAAS